MTPLSTTDYDAIRLSVQVAIAATLLSLPFGFGVAYLITFVKFRGKMLLEVLVNLPLTLPPVVVGYFLLLLLGKHGWLGSLFNEAGIRLIFTLKAAVIASAVVGFPLLVRSLRIGMEGIDPQLINASRTLGPPWHDT
ncbi:MAG: molybdate ABC transporter permease subunit, partial [Deltaproteobacteria bacterium]